MPGRAFSGGSGGGSGEINTASNVGTAGVGVFKQKTGVNLEFKKLSAGSSKVTITDDTLNSEVDIDVSESSLTLDNLGGTLSISKGGTGGSSASTARSNLGLGNVENTAISTWGGSSNLTTTGTIASGTWNATTISTGKGGTGLSTIGSANQILGVNNAAGGLEYKTLTAGTNITITHGANSITIAASGGGGSYSLYAENASAPTAPSATGTNAQALGSAAIASGTRAIAGANSRAAGNDSVALGIQDNSVSYGTGTSAQSGFALGYVAKATGAYGKALGEGTIASGTQATAIGDNTQATQQCSAAWGSYCKSTAQYSMALGRDSVARLEGQLAFSSGVFSNGAANGASQCSLFTLRRQTTSASQTLELFLDNASTRISLQTGEAIVFDGLVIGKEADATGHVGAYKIEGVLKNVGGVYTLSTSTVTTIFEDDSTWGVALSASSGLKIDATGDATNNVRWTAWVRAAHLLYVS